MIEVNQFRFKQLTLILAVIALWILSVVGVVRILGKDLPGEDGKLRLERSQTVVEEESIIIEIGRASCRERV